MITYYDAQNKQGLQVTPQGMARKFQEAISTRGTGDDPAAPLKAFLFFNAMSIINYLKEQK